jgi:hypothetical protein
MILEHHAAFGKPGKSDPAPSNQQIAGAARRLMAAECCMFLGNVAPSSERFAPYRRWLTRLLHAGDSIITFNYDRVLEVLGTADKHQKLVIRTLANLEEEFPSCVNVYKLHGSVNWKRDGDALTETTDPDFALNCGIDQIAIASPGPTKQSVTELLRPLWKQAMAALQAASRIVFIGYSFPQADANARSNLIGIIQMLSSRHVDFQIVLGPDTHLPAPVRLEAMLLYSMRGRNRLPLGQAPGNSFMLDLLPLFAEDFFTVAEPSPLEQF